MDSTILELADRNRREALSILETLQIEAIWRSVGATPHLVGSLRSGLLMKHLDIDLHIYSPAPLHIGDSFAPCRASPETRGSGRSNTPICSTPKTTASSGTCNMLRRTAACGRST